MPRILTLKNSVIGYPVPRLYLRVGFEYNITGGLALRAGIGMDRAALPAEYLNFTNIDVDKFTLLPTSWRRERKGRKKVLRRHSACRDPTI